MSQTPHTLGAVLSQEQLQHLNRMIGDILGKPQSAYNANSGTVEVLKDLQQLCKDPLPLEREHLGKAVFFQGIPETCPGYGRTAVDGQTGGSQRGRLCGQIV